MSKHILKVAFAGSALVVAASAVGYTQISAFKAPAAEKAAAVAQTDAAELAPVEQVAAFVTETRQMARPAVATLADMRASETLIVAQGIDHPLSRLGGSDVMDDIDISDLLDGLNSDGNIPGVTPPARPTASAPRVAATTEAPDARVKPRIEKSQSKSRRVKRRVWSTGQYR